MRSPRPSVSACVAPVWCPSGVSRQSLETVWKLRTSSISWSREPAQNGQKDTLFGASRYRQTRDPTRPATFQTVSRETVWKIAEGLSTGLIWRQEATDRGSFDPSWLLSEP